MWHGSVNAEEPTRRKMPLNFARLNWTAIFDRHFTPAPLAYAIAYHVGEIIIATTDQVADVVSIPNGSCSSDSTNILSPMTSRLSSRCISFE